MGQVIWTNHLKERIRERHIDQKLVELTLKFPNRVENSRHQSSQKFIKNFGEFQIIAAVRRQANDWIVTSVWQKNGNYPRPKPFVEKLIHFLLPRLKKLFSRRSN